MEEWEGRERESLILKLTSLVSLSEIMSLKVTEHWSRWLECRHTVEKFGGRKLDYQQSLLVPLCEYLRLSAYFLNTWELVDCNEY